MLKKIMYSIAVFTLFYGASCEKTNGVKTTATLYNIPYGICSQTLKANEICFDSLVEDSRCPSNVQCPWTGIGIVRLKITSNNTIQYVKLSTIKTAGNIFPPNDTVINGLQYTLKALNPYPNGTLINPSAYSIQIEVQ